MTTFGSLFAGAGGFDLGFESAGWECRWQVEKDPKALDVLAYHWPDVARFDDVCTVTNLEPVDVIVGGFPCQDLSVAGQRAGMVEGTRSGLFFEFVRIVKEMREQSNTNKPRYAIWENVPGLLTLGDTLGNIYSAWDEIGAVVQEHRVVDAQFFGVPQRRRRVIGVVSFDSRSEHTAEILADPAGSERDTQPCRTAGEIAAALTASGVGAGGGPDDNSAQANHLIPATYRQLSNCEYTLDSVASTAAARDYKSATDLIVPADLPKTMGTLTTAFGNKNYSNHQEVMSGSIIAFHPTQTPISSTGVAHTLGTGSTEGQATAAIHQPGQGVRRLSPLECERLMGWPDHHTAEGASGQIADSHRYRLCGNGVVAPVAQWVAERVTQNMVQR